MRVCLCACLFVFVCMWSAQEPPAGCLPHHPPLTADVPWFVLPPPTCRMFLEAETLDKEHLTVDDILGSSKGSRRKMWLKCPDDPSHRYDQKVRSLVRSFVRSLVRSFARSFVRSFVHAFVSITRSLVCGRAHRCRCIHPPSFTHIHAYIA